MGGCQSTRWKSTKTQGEHANSRRLEAGDCHTGNLWSLQKREHSMMGRWLLAGGCWQLFSWIWSQRGAMDTYCCPCNLNFTIGQWPFTCLPSICECVNSSTENLHYMHAPIMYALGSRLHRLITGNTTRPSGLLSRLQGSHLSDWGPRWNLSDS